MVTIRSMDTKIKLSIEKNNIWKSEKIHLATKHVLTYKATYVNNVKLETNVPGFALSRMELFNGVSLYRFQDKLFSSIDACQQAASNDFENRLRSIFFNREEIEYIEHILLNQGKLEEIASTMDKSSEFDRTLEYAHIIQDLNKVLNMLTRRNKFILMDAFRKDNIKLLKEKIFLELMGVYQRENNIETKDKISEVITSLDLY